MFSLIEVAALLSGRGSESSRLQLAFLVAAAKPQNAANTWILCHTTSQRLPQDMEGAGSATASFVTQLTDGDTTVSQAACLGP